MTHVQYTVNGLALLALAVSLAVYDIRTLGISIGERNAKGGTL